MNFWKLPTEPGTDDECDCQKDFGVCSYISLNRNKEHHNRICSAIVTKERTKEKHFYWCKMHDAHGKKYHNK